MLLFDSVPFAAPEELRSAFSGILRYFRPRNQPIPARTGAGKVIRHRKVSRVKLGVLARGARIELFEPLTRCGLWRNQGDRSTLRYSSYARASVRAGHRTPARDGRENFWQESGHSQPVVAAIDVCSCSVGPRSKRSVMGRKRRRIAGRKPQRQRVKKRSNVRRRT